MTDGRVYGRGADYTIESLDTGLRLLQLFLSHDTLTVTAAAERLGVGRSTAHRVLSTLEGRGFAVRESPGSGYSAGPELGRLAGPAGFDPAERERIGAVLADAAGSTGETVRSTTLIGDLVLVTDGLESGHPVRVAPAVGSTQSAHATSGGKMLLSAMTADQVRVLYPLERLPRVTPYTVTSREALLAELAETRELGRAIDRGESVPGMNSVAVPLPGPGRGFRLALVAAAPADRGSDAELAERAEQLRRSARLFSAGPPRAHPAPVSAGLRPDAPPAAPAGR